MVVTRKHKYRRKGSRGRLMLLHRFQKGLVGRSILKSHFRPQIYSVPVAQSVRGSSAEHGDSRNFFSLSLSLALPPSVGSDSSLFLPLSSTTSQQGLLRFRNFAFFAADTKQEQAPKNNPERNSSRRKNSLPVYSPPGNACTRRKTPV